MVRADADVDAVIYKEEYSPRNDARTADLTLSVAIPVPRALDALEDDPRAIALREACCSNGLAYAQTLAPDESWGCPVYAITITCQRITG